MKKLNFSIPFTILLCFLSHSTSAQALSCDIGSPCKIEVAGTVADIIHAREIFLTENEIAVGSPYRALIEWDSSSVGFQGENSSSFDIPTASFEYQIGKGVVRQEGVDVQLFSERAAPRPSIPHLELVAFFGTSSFILGANQNVEPDSLSWIDSLDRLTSDTYEDELDTHSVGFRVFNESLISRDPDGVVFDDGWFTVELLVDVDSVSVVPEPASPSVLYVSALLAMAFRRRR